MLFEINPLISELLVQSNSSQWMQDRNNSLSIVAGMQGKTIAQTVAKESRVTLQQALESNPQLNVAEFFQYHAPDKSEWEFLYDSAVYRKGSKFRMRTYLDLIERYPENFVPNFIFSEEKILPKLTEATLLRLNTSTFRWEPVQILRLYRLFPNLRSMLRQAANSSTLEAISYIDPTQPYTASFGGDPVATILLTVDSEGFLRYLKLPQYTPRAPAVIDAAIKLAIEGKLSTERVIEWISQHPSQKLHNLTSFLADDAVAAALVPNLLYSNIEAVIQARRLPKKFDFSKLTGIDSWHSSSILHSLRHYDGFATYICKHMNRDWRLNEETLYDVKLPVHCIIHFNKYPSAAYVLWACRNYPALFVELCNLGHFSQNCISAFLRAGQEFDIRMAKSPTQEQITQWLTGIPADKLDAHILQLQFEGFPVHIPPHLAAHSKALTSAKI